MKHVVMVFRFTSMDRAKKFETALEDLKVKAFMGFEKGSWQVTTDTLCLEYAGSLGKLLGVSK